MGPGLLGKKGRAAQAGPATFTRLTRRGGWDDADCETRVYASLDYVV